MTAPTNSDLTIDLANVSKTYRGKVRALQGVAMQVGRGEIFGLLGPNGAGKSTLVKILMTIVRASKCEGTMLGAPVGHKPALARVGYLPEHLRFPDYLNGQQALDYFAALAKVPRKARRQRAGELLDLVGLTGWERKKISSYSKGMKQRLGLAQSLMNDPDLVLLDEPTDGVDPVGRREIRSAMVQMKDQGKTVFINSHLLGEVEMVCDRVSILAKGQVAAQGSLEELSGGGQRYEIEIGGDSPGDAADALAQIASGAPTTGGGAASWRGELKTGETVEIVDGVVRIDTIAPAPVQPVIDALRRGGATISAVRLYRPTLEDLFIKTVTDPETGRTLTPGAAHGRVRKGRAAKKEAG